MTMRKIPFGGAWTPYPVIPLDGSPTINLTAFISEADNFTKVAYTLVCPVSGDLDMFEVYMSEVADDTTTIKFSFQDLDANGLPDGVVDQYRVVTIGDIASTWVSPGLMTSDGTDGGTLRTVTRGQKIAAVIEFDSSNTGDLIEFGAVSINEDGIRRMHAGYKYYDANEAEWFLVGNGVAVGALRYTGPKYFPMLDCLPITGFTETTINTGTTPDEIGVAFSTHFDFMLGDVAFCLSGAVNGAGWDAVLYDPSGTAIETVAMKLYTSLFTGYTYWSAKFSNDRRITANEIWRVTVKPSSASSIKLLEVSFNDTAIRDGLFQNTTFPEGTDPDVISNNVAVFQGCTRTDGGEWSTDAYLPLISFHVTGVEQVTGGGTGDWTGDE
jgi:hypothetical protein